jgi:hypothetical protein
VSEASLLGDQRALMEEFFSVLTAKGVVIGSSEQAQALGTAVADMAKALGMVDESAITPGEVVAEAKALANVQTPADLLGDTV